MKRSIATILVCFFLLGNMELAPVKNYCGDFLVLQGIELSSTIQKASWALVAGASSYSDSNEDADNGQDEVNVSQLNQSLNLRKLLPLPTGRFFSFLSAFYAWELRLRDSSTLGLAKVYLPSHSFTHLRLQAFLQIFLN
ncbi:MAG: hypothetical protein V4714_12655 [Bacteroidota bacterium]